MGFEEAIDFMESKLKQLFNSETCEYVYEKIRLAQQRAIRYSQSRLANTFKGRLIK